MLVGRSADDAALLALPAGALADGWRGRVDRGAAGVLFDRPRPVLSSALVNGGWGQAGGFCNMTVDAAAPRHAGGPAARSPRPRRREACPPTAWVR